MQSILSDIIRSYLKKLFITIPLFLDVQDRLWSDFENQLAEVDNNQILEDNYVYLNSPFSPDFRDRDWHNFSYEIGKMVDQIKVSIDKLFKKWIDLINVEKGSKYKFEHISEKLLYIV